MSAPIDLLLPRLDKVKPAKHGQWVACCPAHDDRTPSLRIKEASDGKLLLKCWAGCTAAEIVAAIGLELRDLFPSDGQRSARKGPSREAVEFERRIVTIGRALLAQGKPLPQPDRERLELAHRRLAQLEGMA